MKKLVPRVMLRPITAICFVLLAACGIRTSPPPALPQPAPPPGAQPPAAPPPATPPPVVPPATPPPVVGPAPDAWPLMGTSRLSAEQLVAWFNGRQPRPAGEYRATVPVERLAQLFVDEGMAEGVAGDLAFIQAVVETGWFRFNGTVPPWKNNFAGLAATSADADAASFPDAQTGVRAQIQHLRAYGDPGAYACAVPPLHRDCVDGRFQMVVPKGKAGAWTEMGNGNWAAASGYAATILRLYREALAFNAQQPTPIARACYQGVGR